MDMSVAFLSDYSDELGSGDCGDYEYDDHDYYQEDEDEDNDFIDVSLYIKVNKPNNDSMLCANLFILRVVPASYLCSLVSVSLPQSSVPRSTGTKTSFKVGSVVYNSVKVMPGNDFNITSYTIPKYAAINVYHNLPGCLELDPNENIVECEAPSLNFNIGDDDVSINVVNGTSARNITLRVFHNSRNKGKDMRNLVHGDQHYVIPKSDIVPCLCFQAWYSDLDDGFRNVYCPFKNYSEEKVVNESVLIVDIKDNVVLYNLSASCNLSAEFSLCWKPSDDSDCQEIPNTRREILSEEKEFVIPECLHPSICLQVQVKNFVHTYCLPDNKTKINETTAIVSMCKYHNTSFCFMRENQCLMLENATGQMRSGSHFQQKIVKDIITGQCMRIFKSGENHEVYACDVTKYMRSRWNWSRVLCLLAVACVLLIILLKNENLKKWLKSMTAGKSLSDIFNNRRILILYSPDNQEYENLVHIFASSLKDLQLDVVLDQWHRVQISKTALLPWYHEQKSIVSEKEGLIILLFSEEARKKYIAWQAQDTTQHIDLDPNQSFGAVLNCVLSDFNTNKAKGLYIVATLSPSIHVPAPFNTGTVYEIPLHLEMLLKEIAGVNAKKLGYKQVNRLSKKIQDRLSGKNKPKFVNSKGSVIVELQPLVQGTSNIS